MCCMIDDLGSGIGNMKLFFYSGGNSFDFKGLDLFLKSKPLAALDFDLRPYGKSGTYRFIHQV